MLRFCTEVNRATFAQTITSRGLSGNSGFFYYSLTSLLT